MCVRGFQGVEALKTVLSADSWGYAGFVVQQLACGLLLPQRFAFDTNAFCLSKSSVLRRCGINCHGMLPLRVFVLCVCVCARATLNRWWQQRGRGGKKRRGGAGGQQQRQQSVSSSRRSTRPPTPSGMQIQGAIAE